MSLECTVAEITDRENHVLDLVKLFELSESRRGAARRSTTSVALVPRSIPSTTPFPKLERGALVLRGRMPTLSQARRRAGGAPLADAFKAFAQNEKRRGGTLPPPHAVKL